MVWAEHQVSLCRINVAGDAKKASMLAQVVQGSHLYWLLHLELRFFSKMEAGKFCVLLVIDVILNTSNHMAHIHVHMYW